MTGIIRYLTLDEVIALHHLIMEQTGWAATPLRSPGLLESAVVRPQTLAHYEGADLPVQAISLAVGISQNQPFLDGNKRTAYVVMLTFLELNAFTVDAAPLQIAEQLVHIAERSGDREVAIEKFAAWLRERLRPLQEPS